MVKKRVDDRVRQLIEEGVRLEQRSLIVLVGDHGKDQAGAGDGRCVSRIPRGVCGREIKWCMVPLDLAFEFRVDYTLKDGFLDLGVTSTRRIARQSKNAWWRK